MPETHSETHRLVLPAHLNQYGFLFGGTLLAWVDETCWVVASIDFPDCRFVTIAMDNVEFHHSVRKGTILSIHCEREKVGRTSVSYMVKVRDVHRPEVAAIFGTRVTLVNVDEDGTKMEIGAGG